MVDRLFPWFCLSCTRIGGKQGGGKYINGKRCTGACLHWAYHALDKLLAQGELESELQRPGSLWYISRKLAPKEAQLESLFTLTL